MAFNDDRFAEYQLEGKSDLVEDSFTSKNARN